MSELVVEMGTVSDWGFRVVHDRCRVRDWWSWS